MNAFGDIGLPTGPALIQSVTDDDESVRGSVAIALGRIGPDAKAAVPALTDVIKAHENREGFVRQNAVEALRKIDPDAASQAGVE